MVITLWSPAGLSTARLSLDLSRELARYERTLLVELPCLGIPRLGFITNIADRENNTEAAILEMEKKGELSLNYLHKRWEDLAILPANAFAAPDFPITNKVEMDTLIDFPGTMSCTAFKKGYQRIVFECQGQLTCPMTFFALKHAAHILIPVQEPGEIAFSLINIKRLVQVFKFSPGVFTLVTRTDEDTLREVAVLKDEEGKLVSHLRVVGDNLGQMVKTINPGNNSLGDGTKEKGKWRAFSLHMGGKKVSHSEI